MATDFTYPLRIQLPCSNPHTEFSSNAFGSLELPPEWETPIQCVMSYMDKIVITNQHGVFIPVGTKLYHGSLDPSLDFKHLPGDHITFFGIDVVISLWYILELQFNLEPSEFTSGTLYEFIVTHPIPVEIVSNLYEHPTEKDSCMKEPIGCIHPQISFHGDVSSEPPYDLSIEFTLNLNKHGDYGPFKNYIELQNVYNVDTNVLFKNKDKPFSEFNPIAAITSIKNYVTGGTRKRSKRKLKMKTKKNKERV